MRPRSGVLLKSWPNTMQYKEIITLIRSEYNPKNIQGMARFGIQVSNAYGVPMPFIRRLGKSIGTDHSLALKLWDSGIHEARIIASIIDDPMLVSEPQMDRWAKDFNSWDICDQTCMNLFRHTKFAYKKVFQWAKSDKEFIKRAAYSLIATIASGDKEAGNEKLAKFFPLIKKGALDGRNFVKKSVNWALRQIGKRNMYLNKAAIRVSEEILSEDSKSARWIAKDALRELKSKPVINRLRVLSKKT